MTIDYCDLYYAPRAVLERLARWLGVPVYGDQSALTHRVLRAMRVGR